MFCLHIWLLVLLMMFVHFGNFFRYDYEDYYNGYAENKMVSGSDAYIKNYPHQVSLRTTFPSGATSGCSGSIVTKWIVITAAHCFIAKKNATINKGAIMIEKATNIEVRYGSSFEDSGGRTVQTTIYKDPSYDANARRHDLGILLVAEAMIFDIAKPIELNFNYINIAIATATGWGRINPLHANSDNQILQKGNLIVMSNENCNRFGDKYPIHDEYICTVNAKNVSTCKGDSGGPLIVDNKLVGVTSTGFVHHPCTAVNVNAQFTSIAYYKNYIQNTIKNLMKMKNYRTYYYSKK